MNSKKEDYFYLRIVNSMNSGRTFFNSKKNKS